MQLRQEKIIEMLTQKRKLEVNTLSKDLGVSKVTIRKDLNYLEEQGLLKHAHGFAILTDPEDLKIRLTCNHSVKVRIAKEAAKMVEDGDTVMIESGSACALFAEELGKSGKRVTIITISCFIAKYVSDYPNLQIFLTGGQYQANSEVLVGSIAKKLLQNFHVKYLFVGTDGFSAKNGFYNNDISRAEIGETMARQARELIILTDSSKFEHESLIHQFNFDEVTKVITDKDISNTAKKIIKDNNIQLKLV